VSTIAERVAKGAAFLDEHDPDWWRADVERAIDLKVLALSQTDRCVLGQRCPLEVLAGFTGTPIEELSDIDFSEAYDAYAKHLSGLTSSERIQWAHDLGFAVGGSFGERPWCDLTAEWRRVITERRAAA
jgi:hypothetical protein